MDTSTAILQVAVILMAARIMGELAVYLRAPSVIGEIGRAHV
jgi:Kef-type K+ transport system membrane component KefB